MAGEATEPGSDQNQVALLECGLIMPISATEAFSAEHWSEVQTLLHRGIRAEGFQPHNVWDETGTDRISERVIGNIFRFPIVVADVSDLNPNVMFELGLRLASKKPTVVVHNEGGKRAFDIADFHTLSYPADLSMLKMEKFIVQLRDSIRSKYEASKEANYVPFLGNVIVDVLSPTQRELPLSELILSRLDRLDNSIKRQMDGSSSDAERGKDEVVMAWSAGNKRSFFFRVPPSRWEEFCARLTDFGPEKVESVGDVNGLLAGHVVFANMNKVQSLNFEDILSSLLSEHNGIRGAPKSTVDKASW